MANEAVVVELTNTTGFPRRYTVADANTITRGTVLTLSDPRTAATIASTVVSTNPSACAGIAREEKTANDGITSIAAWTNGIFDMKASGAIALGAAVVAVGLNCVAQANANVVAASGAMIIGYSLETASADEVVNIRLVL